MVRKQNSSLINSPEKNNNKSQNESCSSDEEGFVENSLPINNNSQIVKPDKEQLSPSTSNEFKRGRGRPKKKVSKNESTNSNINTQHLSSTVQRILRDFELLDESDDGINEESPSISDIDNSLMNASDSDSHQTTNTNTTNTNNSILVQHDDTNSQFGNYDLKSSSLIPIENSETIISISSEENSVSMHQNDPIILKNDIVCLPSKSDVLKENLNINPSKFFPNEIKTEGDTASANILETQANTNIAPPQSNTNIPSPQLNIIINSPKTITNVITSQSNSSIDLKIVPINISPNIIEKKIVNPTKLPTTSFNDNNLLECRRSSRKKIMKYDVKDLFNLNKPKKIQIEARIDSLPSANTLLSNEKQKKATKIELKDIIKKPIERNINSTKLIERNVNNVIVKNIYNKNETESKTVRKQKESLNKSREDLETYPMPIEQKDEFKKYKELFENKFRPNIQRKISAESSKSTDSLNNDNQTMLSGILKSPLLKIKFKHNLANRQSLDSLRRMSANSTNSNEYLESLEEYTRAESVHNLSIKSKNDSSTETPQNKLEAVIPNINEKVKVKRGRPPKNKTSLLSKSLSQCKETSIAIEKTFNKSLEEKNSFDNNIHKFENDCYNGNENFRNKFTNNKVPDLNSSEGKLLFSSSASPNSQNNFSPEIVKDHKIFTSKVRIKKQKSNQLSSSESEENISNLNVIDKGLGTENKNCKTINSKENNITIDQNLLNNFESVELISNSAHVIPKEIKFDSFAQTEILLKQNNENNGDVKFKNNLKQENCDNNAETVLRKLKDNNLAENLSSIVKCNTVSTCQAKNKLPSATDQKLNKDQNEHTKFNESVGKKIETKNFEIVTDVIIYKPVKIENKVTKETIFELSEKKSKDIKTNAVDRKQKNQIESKKIHERMYKSSKSNDHSSRNKEKTDAENLKTERKIEKLDTKVKNKNKYDSDKNLKVKDGDKPYENSGKQPEDSFKNNEKFSKDEANKLLPSKSIDKLLNKNPQENISVKKIKEKKVLDFEKHLQAIEEISVQKVKFRDRKRSVKKQKEVNCKPVAENVDVSKSINEKMEEKILNDNKIILTCAESVISEQNISVQNVDKSNKNNDEELNLVFESKNDNLIDENNIEKISSSTSIDSNHLSHVLNVEPTMLEFSNPPIQDKSNEVNIEKNSETKNIFCNTEIGTSSSKLIEPIVKENTILAEKVEFILAEKVELIPRSAEDIVSIESMNIPEGEKNTNISEKRIESTFDSPAEDPLKDIEKFIEAAGNLLNRSHDITEQKDTQDSTVKSANLDFSENITSSEDNINSYISSFKESSNETINKSFINSEISEQISSPKNFNAEMINENRKFGPRTPPFPPPADDSFDFNPPKPEINLTSLSKKNEKNFKKSLRKLKKNENISNELKQTIKELKKLKKKSKNGAFNFNEDPVNLTNSSNEDSNSMKENKLSEDYDDGRRRSHRIKTILKTNCSSVGRGLVRDRERLVGNDSIECGPYPDLSEIEAQNAKFLKDMEERLSQFKVIKDNEYKCERGISKEAKKMVCDCFLTREEEERGEYGCGEDCLNRLLMIECGPSCTVGERCTNRRFQRGQYAPCKVFRTEKKGFGIMADAEIQSGEFIMEYVGEVLNSEQFYKRAELYSKDKNKHHYFMALRSDAIIDATSRGNISRFINHSCEPNAQTQKWTVNGELRIGFFTTKSVLPGEEITFDYKFQRYGKEAQKCYCGTLTCRGWIGEEPDSEDEMKDDDDTEYENENQEQKDKDNSVDDGIKTAIDALNEKKGELLENKESSTKENVKPERKKRQKKQFRIDVNKLDFLEDPDLDEEVTRLRQSGLKNQAHTLKLSRLLVRAKLQETRLNLLEILRNGELPCLRLFLDYHGLKLLYGWMNDTEAKEDLLNMRLSILQTLEILPIVSKTVLKDSKVYQTIENWYELANTLPTESNNSEINSLEIEIKSLSEKLLKQWDQLPEIFRIPRKERVEQMKEHEREADRQYTALKLFDDEQSDLNQRNRDRFQRSKYSNNTSIQIQSSTANKFKWSRDNSSKTDPRLDQSRLSKIERRQLFAAKVAQNEAHKRMADEKREFEIKCKYYWLNPLTTHPRDIPFWVNTNTGQWYTRDNRKIPTPPSHVHLLPKPKNISKNINDYKIPAMELPPLWKFAIDPSNGGRIYYYHVKIRIPQWEPPIKLLPLSGDRNDLRNQIKASNDQNEESSEAYTDSEVDDQEQQNSTTKKKMKRYKLLVQERPISPRRDEDRMYNQIEMRRYKENKEKIRKRKEEIKRKKSQLRDQLGINSIETSSESPNLNLDKFDGTPLPIADYLISSDEDDTISSQFNTKLLEKIVQGEKCVDELDVLQTKKALKRHLINVKERISDSSSPIQEVKKRKLEEKISKTKLNDDDIVKKSKSLSSGKQSSKYVSRKSKKNQNKNSWYNKEKFTTEIAGVIEQHLSPYRKESCKVGRILSDGDFEHLTRKLAHFVMLKELKHCDATGQILVVTDSVKNKSREFIKKYMTKYGEIYKRPENDPEFKEIPR